TRWWPQSTQSANNQSHLRTLQTRSQVRYPATLSQLLNSCLYPYLLIVSLFCCYLHLIIYRLESHIHVVNIQSEQNLALSSMGQNITIQAFRHIVLDTKKLTFKSSKIHFRHLPMIKPSKTYHDKSIVNTATFQVVSFISITSGSFLIFIFLLPSIGLH